MVIIRKPNSIVFRNPGRMLVSPEDFYAGSHSECRNPVLQKMFMLLGYGEKAGSGADFIVQGWADNNWPRPQIQEKVQPDCVELTFDIDQLVQSVSSELHSPDTRTEEDGTQITTDGAQNGTQKTTGGAQNSTQETTDGTHNGTQKTTGGTHNGTQKTADSTQKGVNEKTIEKIYCLMHETPTITRRKIADILNISEEAVKKHIHKLKVTGRIIRVGGDKGGYWKCND